MAGKTEVNVEGTGLGVHAGDEHDVMDFFFYLQGGLCRTKFDSL